MTHKIRRAAQLTISDWRYLAKASVELFAARFRLSTIPPERILRELQDKSSVVPDQKIICSAEMDVERISWAIAVAGRYVPWRTDCLIQVMAADRWLRKHDLCADFYLGVAKELQKGLTAHAWLRHGDLTVTGGSYDRFSVLIEPSMK